MPDTYIDSAGTVRDKVGVILSDAPSKIGVVEGDIALLVVETDTYTGNDGYPRDALPAFYPGTATYEDAAGNTVETLAIGGQPDVDFTGWSTGSDAGIYVDGEIGGKFPTGCVVNLTFDELDIPILEITEATHIEDGIEAITFSLTAAGAGCGFELVLPGPSASEGQTWALSACIRVDSGDATPQNIIVSLTSDVVEIAFDDAAIQDGGNLAGSLRTVQGVAPADTASVFGVFSFVVAPAGSVTVSLSLKLDEIS